MNYSQALSRLTALCAKGEHCSQDIRQKLQRWEIPQAEQEKIMNYLIDEKYVDDARYARLYAKEKLRFNKWGKQKISFSLLQKGIDKSLIDDALNTIEESEYIAALKEILQQKARNLQAKSNYERNAKLIKYALSRGFTYDLIRQCLSL